MANDLNVVTIIGRLVRDMESAYTAGGMAIGKFSIACDKRIKKGDEYVQYTSFLDCKCFGKTAENLAQYMVKGKQVAIEGELTQDRWEKEGKTNSRVLINCNQIHLLGGGNAASGEGERRQPAPSKPNSAPQSDLDDCLPPDFPDDIPF
jgi:single-strand DNA-binding protein